MTWPVSLRVIGFVRDEAFTYIEGMETIEGASWA